jgi:hypothetical protein
MSPTSDSEEERFVAQRRAVLAKLGAANVSAAAR